ncbi:MAG: hypothetical protein GXO16_08430, partial [Epsilonproteobacteria bacterium]|nr:hypothetical protein [Campylobacterota bacterium]
ATILSSVDSILVAAASALSVDFGLDKWLKKESTKIWFYRLSVVLVGGIALIFALFSQQTVFAVIVFAVSVMTASIGAPMVLVVLKRFDSAKSLMSAVVVGLVVSVMWKMLGFGDYISEGFVGFVCAILVAALMYRSDSNPTFRENESRK